MKSTADLIAEAKAMATRNPGYHYNTETLTNIITVGVLPEGVTLMTAGTQNLVRAGNDILCINNGQVTRRTPLTPETEQQLLVGYAVVASQLGATMGKY
jgi:hypothetical protein